MNELMRILKMERSKMKEIIIENLSILRGYLLDSARSQREAGNTELADMTTHEARGVEIAMNNVKRTFEGGH